MPEATAAHEPSLSARQKAVRRRFATSGNAADAARRTGLTTGNSRPTMTPHDRT